MKKLLCILFLTGSVAVHAEQPVASDVAGQGEAPVIPENFDHNAHLDLGIDCESCHTETGKVDLKPEPCADCHQDG